MTAKETPALTEAGVPVRGARARILDTASDLFYRQGIRAVGIDTIVAQSGVAKMSLYRHFASKDELIVAYLALRNEGYWTWFNRAVARHPGDPRAQLLSLFASLRRQTLHPQYRGCPFLNALIEFPAPDHPGHRVAIAHKHAVRERLAALAREAGARDPDRLAAHLQMLMDGARLAAQTADAAFDGDAIAAAAALIEAACSPI